MCIYTMASRHVFTICLLITTVAGERPNIVMIVADDMGWNDVSFHGSSQIMTPNIDALAYKGIALNHHYAQPSCSPSRAALLTGRYPVHTGIQMPLSAGSTAALPLNFTLLPEHLSRLGYHSHLVGKWHLGYHRSDYLPTYRGFKSHFGFLNGYVGYFDATNYDFENMAGIDAYRDRERVWKDFVGHYATDLFSQEATSIIKSHEVSKGPLFLQLALSAPHTGNKGSELEVRNLGENEKEHKYISDLHRRLYAGMVRAVDDAVGAVVQALHSRQMLDNSIVLFISDNGAPTLDPRWNYNNFGSNWPLRGMKLSCHEGGVRVAAALWSPLVVGGRVSNQLMHIVDWLPTLYTAAGGAVKDLGEIDGISQWDSLRNEKAEAPRTGLLVELNPELGNEALIRWPWKVVKYPLDYPDLHTHAGESGRGREVPDYAVTAVIESLVSKAVSLTKSTDKILKLRSLATIDERCPLVVNHSFSDSPCDQHYCLFDLESDPCETQDLSDHFPDVVRKLVFSLQTYYKGLVPTPSNTQDPRADPKLWGNYWTTWADNSSSVSPLSGQVAIVLSCYLIMKNLQLP